MPAKTKKLTPAGHSPVLALAHGSALLAGPLDDGQEVKIHKNYGSRAGYVVFIYGDSHHEGHHATDLNLAIKEAVGKYDEWIAKAE